MSQDLQFPRWYSYKQGKNKRMIMKLYISFKKHNIMIIEFEIF